MSVYGNALLKIHFKHLNRDTSKVFSCRAQPASFSLDHRSSLMKKKRPHPQLNKRVTSSAHHLFCCHQPLLAAILPKNKQGLLSILQGISIMGNIVYSKARRCSLSLAKFHQIPSVVMAAPLEFADKRESGAS